MISRNRAIGLSILAVLIFIAYYAGLGSYFSLETLKEHQHTFSGFVTNHYPSSVLLYITTYVVLLACALPITAPMTLLGGFLYGYMAIVYALFATLLGSIITFLVIRYFLARWIRSWHNDKLDQFNAQMQRYGPSYLLMLQFLSVIPLFLINVLSAISHVSFKTVCWTTVVGCLPLTTLLVIGGRKLSTINSVGELFSPAVMVILGLLALLACAPMIFRWIKTKLGK
jgi:uncharacterized membrane protein YdjX (TVP38/TMEM64 family)